MKHYIWVFESSQCPPEGIDGYELFLSKEGALKYLEEEKKRTDQEFLEMEEYMAGEEHYDPEDWKYTLTEETEDKIKYQKRGFAYFCIYKREINP